MNQPESAKDPNTAMVIEIVAGYFGLLGIGYLYAGRTAAGLLRLFGFWVFLTLLVLVASGLSFLPTLLMTSDLADYESALGASLLPLICMLCLIPLILAIPIVSGLMLKRSMRQP